MTQASEIAISPARAHGARAADGARGHGGRWERIFAVLGVCLPVPLLALTGLSIPLPAGVERIGAALVAWTESSGDAADPLGVGDRGSIILASGERVLFQASAGPEPDTARRALASAAPLAGAEPGGAKGEATPKDESGGGGSNGGTDGGGGGGNGGGSTPPDPGGGDPGDEPGLVEGTVKEVTEAPLVEEVDKTVDELLPPGDDESSGGVLEDTLSGLGLGG
jgi:hypothetical protein